MESEEIVWNKWHTKSFPRFSPVPMYTCYCFYVATYTEGGSAKLLEVDLYKKIKQSLRPKITVRRMMSNMITTISCPASSTSCLYYFFASIDFQWGAGREWRAVFILRFEIKLVIITAFEQPRKFSTTPNPPIAHTPLITRALNLQGKVCVCVLLVVSLVLRF